jgi:hypothetical protein
MEKASQKMTTTSFTICNSWEKDVIMVLIEVLWDPLTLLVFKMAPFSCCQ